MAGAFSGFMSQNWSLRTKFTVRLKRCVSANKSLNLLSNAIRIWADKGYAEDISGESDLKRFAMISGIMTAGASATRDSLQ